MKISIVIPAWNVENYIVKCVESCLRLRGAEIEIIIINDGSTDNTLNVVNTNFHNVDNLRVYTTENRGLSAARNYGIKMATGDYIMFLDADDWLRTDINQLLSNESIFDNLDVLFFCCQMIDETDENRLYPQKQFPVDFEVYSGEEIFKISRERYAGAGFFHFAWLGVYRRTFLLGNNITFFEGIVYEDYDFWFKVMKCAKRLRYSYRICYAYRLRNGSITHVGFSENILYSIYKTIHSILDKTDLTDDYLACAAAKIELLIIWAEMRTSTDRPDYMEEKIYNRGIEEKKELISLIDKKYGEDNQELVKIKYRLISHLVFCFGIYDDDLQKYLKNMYNKLITEITNYMSLWNLKDEKKRIGFYGYDVQADVIANTYTELLGGIKSEVVYIDESIKSNRLKHYNRNIINIGDLGKEEIDEVIICSNNSTEKIKNRIESAYPHVRVYSPYIKSKFSLMWVVCGNYMEIFEKMQATENKKRILLLETPEYANVGDHLIAVSEIEFLHKYFPEYEVIEITNEEYAFYKCRLKRIIRKSDILVITGGGFFGGMWRQFHYDQALDIIAGYPENKIIVMPQSVYFEKTQEGEEYRKRTIDVFDRDNLSVVCREHFSVSALTSIGINNKNIYQSHDIALYWKYEKPIQRSESIGIFLRSDKESIIEKSEREKIDRVLVYSGLELIHSSMQYRCERIFKQERKRVVDEKLEEIASYKLVVTDQLHCMISCAITRTPCIAFNNISRKLEGVYEYLRDYKFIKFLPNTEYFQETLDELIRTDTSELIGNDFSEEWDNLASYMDI